MNQTLFKNRNEFFRLAGLLRSPSSTCSAWARSPIESVFLEDWGKDRLPLAWIGVAIGALATVSVWDRLASRFPVDFALSAGSCVGLAILSARRQRFGGPRSWPTSSRISTSFSWSRASTPLRCNLPSQDCPVGYGLFGVMASLGGRVGNKSLDPAASMGSGRVPWLVLPTFVIVCFFVGWIARGSMGLTLKKDRPPGLIDAVKTVRSSRYLVWMVVLIARSAV